MAKIAVIGGGLGGLSGAIRLAKMGHDVELFEKNDRLGGKMNEQRLGAYRFDAGPSLITMPFIIEELFDFAGVRRRDFIEFVAVEPICRYFFPDGSTFNAHADRRKMIDELRSFAPAQVHAFEKFMAYAKRIYDITTDVFVLHSIHELADLLTWRTAAKMVRIGQIDAFRTVHQAVSRFFQDKRLVQVFDRYPTYNGSDPFQAPATLNTIPYVEFGLGGFYIRGGLYRLVEALAQVAQGLGVTLQTSMPVEKILHREKKICGLQVNGTMRAFDALLCNADVVESFHTLIDDYTDVRDRLSAFEPSLSGMVFLWGVRRRFDRLAQHNIFFSENYEHEFRQIFADRTPPDDPTVYIAITSKADAEHAPADGENWFVLINMPYLTGEQNWAAAVEKTRGIVLSKLKRHGLEIRDVIEQEQVYTPKDFHRLYGSNKGSIYGISSNDRRMAFRRPANRCKRLAGLYFAGGSSHPGGGVPLVIQSGKIAAELIDKQMK
ncbi:phytoene desaturase [candidate division KSB1 bacterium]|nr:phytoene desaturase [candidate division KSB1 bacterium]RQW06937.1 MAG: phytoene desaturase [candidate division KSB1 bacterium]